jgi:hypothetical protein
MTGESSTTPQAIETDVDPALKRLRVAIEDQRAYLLAYEKPSEPIAYETLRSLDDLFCRELFEGVPTAQEERQFRSISTWGVNHALRRIVPQTLENRPFRDFQSRDQYHERADDFVFGCGTLQLAERFEEWLREGVVTGRLSRHQHPDEARIVEVLVLRSAMPSHSDEEIGRAGLRWVGNLAVAKGRGAEARLAQRHRKLMPELSRRADLIDGWRASYTSTRDIDDYFLEWAQLYLRRIHSQDLVGADDHIGGRPFSRYVAVLTALSGRSQKHLAFASILATRHRSLNIRNLLTAHAPREEFVLSLARYMDADRAEIEGILASFVLSAENLDIHTRGSDTAWAPLVQASSETMLLPMFGLDINPFLFLLTDIRARYEKDWFRVANNRERRWIEEISDLFEPPRWQTHGRNLRLREGGKDVTDIDFAMLDRKSNQVGLVQLKWQHPIGMDNRGRRSAGKNLVGESNRWVQAVTAWLDRHGVDELMQRLGFDGAVSPSVHLFVLGRYHVHLTGFDARDSRAVWSDWAHFQRVRVEGPRRSIAQTASALQSAVARSKADKKGEAIMLPIGELGVVLNPSSVPDDTM